MLTQPEQDGMIVLAWWSGANAVVGSLIYKWIYKKWPWLDMERTVDNIKYIYNHFRHPPEFEYIETPKKPRVESPDDYWDGEVNYETGEVSSDSGPTIRYPKNRDRAYSGSAERFDDGGG